MRSTKTGRIAAALPALLAVVLLVAYAPGCSGGKAGADFGEFRIDRRVLPVAPNGSDYSETIEGKGGLAPYIDWTVTAGALPGGLALDPQEARIHGTVDAADGLYPFVVEAIDSDLTPNTDDETFVVRVGDEAAAGPLAVNAGAYEEILAERHAPSGVVLTVTGPDAAEIQWTDFELGARLTGLYLAAAALRFATTGTDADRVRMGEALDAVEALVAVTGEPGLLARGLSADSDQVICCDDAAEPDCDEDMLCGGPNRPEGHAGTGEFAGIHWIGDAGRSEYAAVIFGLSTAASVDDDEANAERIAELIAALVDRVLEDGLKIIDVDGARTSDGDLGDVGRRRGLNALLVLDWVQAAYRVTGEERFKTRYGELIDGGSLDTAARKLDAYRGYDTRWEEVHAAMLAYFDLIRTDSDDARVASMREAMAASLFDSEGDQVDGRHADAEKNPLFNMLYAIALDLYRTEVDCESIVETIAFDAAPRTDRAVDLSGSDDVAADPAQDGWAAEALGIADRYPAPYAWDVNPYLLAGGADDGAEFSGVDYLLVYWLGRYYGRIAREW